jgi:hypothetical protein
MTRAPPALTDACGREGHSGLAKAACTPNEGSLFGIGKKLTLKNGVVIIGQFRYGSGEGRQFDE